MAACLYLVRKEQGSRVANAIAAWRATTPQAYRRVFRQPG